MVVDQHPPGRALRSALRGARVELVGGSVTGQDALPRAVATQPDVLLIDTHLPDMAGVDVVRALAPNLPGTRIVMLSVSEDRRDLFAALDAGATGYLPKDLSADALGRAIRGAADGDLAMPRRLAAEVLRACQADRRRPTPDPRLDLLSAREVEVLDYLARGATDAEIADALRLSVRTVESHVRRILRKLGVRNRTAAALIARAR